MPVTIHAALKQQDAGTAAASPEGLPPCPTRSSLIGSSMPWKYRYDAQLDTFFYTGSGLLTENELVSGLSARTAELLLHPNARVFQDYSQVTEFRVPSETFIKLAEKDPGRLLPLRRAIWVSSPTVAGIISFVLRRDMKGELKIFYDRESTLRWLNEGMPPEKHISGVPWHTLEHFDE